MTLTRTIPGLFVAAALLVACVAGEQQEAATAAPDFTLNDLDGRAVKLSGLRGRVVLIEFWATWCPPCRTSIPALEKLHRKYESRGLTVLAPSMDEGGWEKVRAFAREHRITYAVLKGTDDAAGKYSVRLIPATFLVDRQGVLQKRYIGEMSEDRIEKDIESLL